MSTQTLKLVWPAEEYLSGYIHALEQGWSPDNLRPEAAGEHLARIAQDRDRFLAEQVDREAKGPPVILPNGNAVQRLPGYTRWMWDGEFCGSISFRWQPGTAELPPYCLGHVGYSVVPWKRKLGYATRALELLLPGHRRRRPSVHRAGSGCRQHSFATSDRGKRRQVDRALSKIGRVWW